MHTPSLSWLAFFALVVGLHAQTSAELSGRVTDPTGNIVPGAQITLTREGTAIVQERSTNDTGYFFFPDLLPGKYDVRVRKDGFKSVQREGVTIVASDRARLDFQLDLGSVTETLTVAADASLLQVSSAEVSTSVTAREYDQLPQIQYNRMRSPATFLYLAPGVQGKITTTGQDNVSASNSIRIYGSQSTSNELYLDGTPGRTNFNETAPPLDGIGEFRLQANSLSAEYGNSGSAVVSFTTKSGTNQPHGMLFDIFQNSALNARQFLAPTRSVVHQNEFGANLGGPVLVPKVYDGRNKTFFFFGYVGSRKTGFDQVQRLRLPTPDERAGDFSGVGRVIYDPNTTRTSGATYVRDPFPANRIPSNRFDPVAVNVIKLLPELNLFNAGTLNYQDYIGERLLNPDVFLIRIDQSFGANHRAYGSYTHTHIPRNNVTAAMADPFSDRTNQNITSHMAHGGYDWVVRPNLLNTLQIGFNKFANPFAGYWANQGYAAKFGLKGIVGDSFPVFSFADGYTSLGRSDNSNNLEQSLIVKDMLSWTHGRHVVKAGVEYRMFSSPGNDASNSAGTYSFNDFGTALPTSPNTTGDSYASFLLGQVSSASMSYPFSFVAHKPYWSGFLQDDIRLTPKLTLNLGLRYEIVRAPYEVNDTYSLVDLGTPNPAAGGRLGASIFAGAGPGRSGRHTLLNTRHDGIGPRFGFAWQIDSKTVFRGGYGIFYGDNGVFVATTGFRTVVGLQTLDQGITPPFTLSQGFPATSAQVQLTPGILNGQSVTAGSATVTSQPRTQNWTASLQRALKANWALELSYVANRNTRVSAANMLNINQDDPRYLGLGSLLTQNVTSAAAVAAGIPIPYAGFTGTVAQALRAYPQYLTVSEQSAKAGGSFYNGFSARVRKRYSAGVTLDAHFTWSKNMGNVDSTVQNDFNRQAEWALLSYDVPYALVMNWSYELPFGPDKRLLKTRWARHLVSGWVINGIHYYQSGTPLFITMTNTLPIFNRQLRPNVAPGVSRSTGISNGDFQPNSNVAINRVAFATPAPFTFGTAAPSYGDVRNFPVLQEDFSVVKNTVVRERVTVETIAQFINAANRHRFASVNTNFSNAAFGSVGTSNLGRIITLGLKIKF